MSVTLKDIAQRVNRSVTTVSRALNNFDDVSPNTKIHIQRVAREMGYQPNTTAQRLQKRRTDTIGLVIPTAGPRFADLFFSELIAGIGGKASGLGYDLLVSAQPKGEMELQAYRKMVTGRRVDGFIIARTRCQDERIEYLTKQDVPFVAFGRTGEGNQFTFVDVDGNDGMQQVADHLVENGHHQIAYIAPDPEFNFATSRVTGLHEGLARHGIQVEAEYAKSGDLSQRSGYAHAGKLLDLPTPPTAIVVCNDLMALGAIRAAQERGLVVGRDIAITGFDDIPMAEDTNPPLTTVHQPVFLIGEILCELLVKLIRSETVEREQIVLKPNLIVRASSGFDFERPDKYHNTTKIGGVYNPLQTN